MLRSGYLYVHDEARKRWEGYFVTAGGYYKRFDITQPLPIAYAKGGEPCDYPGHREIASCITITTPKQATNVWFGFSDVEWTDAVLKQHASADYRARHMRKLDVNAWLGSQRAKHAAPINRLDGTVAEYTAAMINAHMETERITGHQLVFSGLACFFIGPNA